MNSPVSELEAEVWRRFRNSDLLGAERMARRHTNSDDRELSGSAHFFLSVILFARGSAFADEARRHVEDALRRLPIHARFYMGACDQGMVLAQYAEDTARMGVYGTKAHGALMTKHEAPAEWRGRYLFRMAHLHRLIGLSAARRNEILEAETAFKECVSFLDKTLAFYEKHPGPYGVHDQRCQVRMARTLMADVMWSRGDHAAALTYIAPWMPELESEAPFAHSFWCGRTALLAGDYSAAALHLECALRGAASISDHFLANQVTEATIQVYAHLRDFDRLEKAVIPLWETAALAFNPDLVYRLDQLLEGCREGRIADSCTHGGSLR